MSNNECRLIGWLEITTIQQEQDADGNWIPVLLGYVHTDREFFGGKHPVIIKGRPASLVLEVAQQVDEPVQVFVMGKLRSPTANDGRSHVVVRYVKILGIGAEYLMLGQDMQQGLTPYIDQHEQDILEFLRE